MICPHCTELSARVEELEEALGYPRKATFDTDKLIAKLGLTFSQASIVMALWRARGRTIAKWALQMNLSEDAEETSTLKVHVSQIRRKVGDPGVILTEWGRGYSLSPSGMALVAAALSPAVAEAAE